MLLGDVVEKGMGVSAYVVVASAVNAIPKVDCWERCVGCGSRRIVGGNTIAEVGREVTCRRSKCANFQGREGKWQKNTQK